MSQSGDGSRFDCGRDGHINCISKGEPFDCRVVNTDTTYRIANREDIERTIEAVRAADMPRADDIAIVTALNVCPVPLIDRTTMELWRLHNAIKRGAPWPWASYWDTPAAFLSAMDAIESEKAQIARET